MGPQLLAREHPEDRASGRRGPRQSSPHTYDHFLRDTERRGGTPSRSHDCGLALARPGPAEPLALDRLTFRPREQKACPRGRLGSAERLAGQCPPVRGGHVPSFSHVEFRAEPFHQGFKNVLTAAKFVLVFFSGFNYLTF